MEFDERFLWFIIGGVLGLIVGYTVAAIQRKTNDTRNIVPSAALMVTVLLTTYAALASQQASNQIDRVASCNQKYLLRTIDALNERTMYNRNRAEANVNLQKAQAKYVNVLLLQPPVSFEERQEALSMYYDRLNNFVRLSSLDDTEQSPYPTPEELQNCAGKR